MTTGTKAIRVLVVDDHRFVRSGVRKELESASDIEVVGETGRMARALEMVSQLRPDVVVLDVRLPDGTGFDACLQIKATRPGTRVLLITSVSYPINLQQAIDCDADGLLLKEVEESDLVATVRQVVAGGSVLDPTVTRRVLEMFRSRRELHPANPYEGLTPLEGRIVDHLRHGSSNKEIADSLHLKEKTVRNYLTTIYEKLSVRSRGEAIARWRPGFGTGGNEASAGKARS